MYTCSEGMRLLLSLLSLPDGKSAKKFMQGHAWWFLYDDKDRHCTNPSPNWCWNVVETLGKLVGWRGTDCCIRLQQMWLPTSSTTVTHSSLKLIAQEATCVVTVSVWLCQFVRLMNKIIDNIYGQTCINTYDKILLDLPPFFLRFDPPFAKWPPCPSVFRSSLIAIS